MSFLPNRTNAKILRSFGVVFRLLGGAVPLAPVVVVSPSILSQPLVGTAVEIDEGVVTGATSIAYQWYKGVPTTTPVSGATSAGFTPTSAEYSATLYRRATYTNATGSTVVDTPAPSITGYTVTEDFDAFTLGDTADTHMTAAGWARTSGSVTTGIPDAVITADAISPVGKSAVVSTPTAMRTWLYRSDTDTFFAANGWSDYYEELALIKHDGDTGRFSFRGKMVAAVTSVSAVDMSAGWSIRLNTPYHQLPGEDPNDPAGTALTNWVANDYNWVRHRMTGTDSQLKIWEYGSPEPEAWTNSRTHGSALTGRGPAIGARGLTIAKSFIWFSCGGNAPAPFWEGFVPPFNLSSDGETFVAAASGTTATEYDGDVVLTMEDV